MVSTARHQSVGERRSRPGCALWDDPTVIPAFLAISLTTFAWRQLGFSVERGRRVGEANRYPT